MGDVEEFEGSTLQRGGGGEFGECRHVVDGLDVVGAQGGQVFEQAGELREMGAGVSLFPNATLLLQRIDLADRIEKIGSPITGLVNRTSLGELIGTSAAPSTGIQSYNVHRADFLKLLADAQMEGTLHFRHRLSAARETHGRVQLTFSSGASVEADIV